MAQFVTRFLKKGKKISSGSRDIVRALAVTAAPPHHRSWPSRNARYRSYDEGQKTLNRDNQELNFQYVFDDNQSSFFSLYLHFGYTRCVIFKKLGEMKTKENWTHTLTGG